MRDDRKENAQQQKALQEEAKRKEMYETEPSEEVGSINHYANPSYTAAR
jgi:hypothetical protein